ncbi:hypothetical protein F3Y22_tig00001120pilonHSYRG00218 [Hibiscus syriacus]|uniref:Xylanase inhibitor C-terminal domain-containing protein n=1 Tax=Hibiscus syriacus TaxID=106335 RepID=A0A6A3CWB9_HIBSY|nr:hypothetical protein F3Y22_tig00001120pilonHSYRG00218 [Hibiscus syriacus]
MVCRRVYNRKPRAPSEVADGHRRWLNMDAMPALPDCFPQRLPVYDPRLSNTATHSLVNIVSARPGQVFFQNTEISGVFGVSISPDSMARQFSTETHSRFSYCFAPITGALPPPLVLRAGGAGGILIDSGALFTFIDAGTIGVNAYERVMQVFNAYYGSKQLQRRPKEQGGFDLCYDQPSFYNDFASLTFHFNGADYNVNGRYVNVFRRGYFCVGVLRGVSSSILGAWHQQINVLSMMNCLVNFSFADEICANDVA